MGRHFLWDPIEDNIVKEIDDGGVTVADYTTEPFPHGSLISQHRDGESRLYHYDGQGNTTSLTDKDGNVTDTYAYNAFGEVTERTGSTVNPFQFVGQFGYYSDESTGTVMVRQNNFLTASGRWLSPDAAIFGSIYAYVHNNPCLFIDPSGLLGQKVVPYGSDYEGDNDERIRRWQNRANPCNGPCSSFSVLFAWQPGQDEKEGFIIQHVTIGISTHADKCPGEKGELAASECERPDFPRPKGVEPNGCKEYLEVWRVHNGKVYSNDVFGLPVQPGLGWGTFRGIVYPYPNLQPTWGANVDPFDMFANFGYSISTKGNFNQTGEAIFVGLDTSNKQWLINKLAKLVSQGGVQAAGGLYAGCMDADLWGKLKGEASGPPTEKTVTKSWDCCTEKDHRTHLTVTIGKDNYTDQDQNVNGNPGDQSPKYPLWCRLTDCEKKKEK